MLPALGYELEHADSLPPIQSDAIFQGATAGTVTPVAPPQAVQSQTAPNVVQQSRPITPNPAIEWFMVPRWMAGTWTKQGDLTLSVTDLRTGRSSPSGTWTANAMTVTWGHLTDRKGNFWHANFIPSERDGWSGGKLVRFITVAMRPEGESEQGLVTRTRYLVTEKLGSEAVDMFQQESLNSYTQLPTGELQNQSSNRVFTYNGQPVRDGALQSKFVRTGPFVAQVNLNGIDMRTSLNQFLRLRNLTDLMVP